MQSRVTHQVRFTGDARTYFGIWIVNLLLSIVTLGIYSAWAKVRTARYFSQNTLIDERRFDYHATGRQILIGRIIVILGIIVLSIPLLNFVAILALLFALPWLLNRSLAFNARMTSFSGLRFGFDGRYGRSFLVFMLYPFLAALTLFLAYPFAVRAKHRYVVGAHRFGTARFGFDGPIGPFYKAMLYAILWSVGIIIVGFFALGGMTLLQDLFLTVQYGVEPPSSMFIRMMLMYVLLIVAILPGAFIYQAYLRNTVYSNMSLEGGHRFVSTVSPMQLMWIALSNAVVTVLTLALMYPWARIRMARYMAASTKMIAAGPLDDFIGREESRVTAIGDAYTDIEGIDLGLAI
ncbi:YjgN family protein [Paracoccus tegillarcae]|uniref:DUF898 domain-containing protein n=1 Tax=Paracoccus tegillarcae TaxID=1529068 RepID=A0A2K9EFU5_9RHOB|nr:YjgN family protein [Paracoccus tegillarcae]AUH33840.1 DUF898 domain-containing protein [Paracoccus tegillarcae]